MEKMKNVKDPTEIKGRVIRRITVGDSHIFQVDVTGSKSYYVLVANRPLPMINSEVQIEIKLLDVFYLNDSKVTLYQEVHENKT